MTGTLPRLTAADLTLSDVETLAAFLDTRVRGALAEHRADTDTWKALLALHLVLQRQTQETREAYGRADDATGTEQDRFRRWNRLAILALGWKDDADFDARWKPVRHPSADGAAAYAVLTGRQ